MLLLTLAGPAFQAGIQLQIDSPPELVPIRTRLRSLDPQRFTDIARLTGMTESESPIHVGLVPEASDIARGIPQWIAGFTIRDSIVVFPARSPSYPNDTVEDVLRHELAHAIIWRVSRGNPIPRWFNEGLAMA